MLGTNRTQTQYGEQGRRKGVRLQGLSNWLNNRLLLAVLLTLGMVVFAACGNGAEEKDGTDQEAEETVTENGEDAAENEVESAFPVTITDGAGHEVTIEEQPETIVTLIPSITESAFALGLGEKIVGVSDFDNYPEEVFEKEQLGGQDIKEEMLLNLAPDVAFVTADHHENSAEVLDQFREAGIEVIVVNTSATKLEDAYDNIRLIGEATGYQEQAEEIVSDIEQRVADLQEKAQDIEEPKKVWVEVSPSPDIFTPGADTFMDDMLQIINAENVAGDLEGWVSVTEEEIIQFNPDVIITTYGYYVDDPAQEVFGRDGWDVVPAVAEEQVFDVDNDTVTRPGPRVADGVETLAELIYPEIFAD